MSIYSDKFYLLKPYFFILEKKMLVMVKMVNYISNTSGSHIFSTTEDSLLRKSELSSPRDNLSPGNQLN